MHFSILVIATILVNHCLYPLKIVKIAALFGRIACLGIDINQTAFINLAIPKIHRLTVEIFGGGEQDVKRREEEVFQSC